MALKKILFHGRHLLHTRFQEDELRKDIEKLQSEGHAVEVVFAVTSANHSNSRYNPVPFHFRAIGIDLFARNVLETLDATWTIIAIPHLAPTEHFVERVVAYAHATHEASAELTPESTTVICSTPPLIAQFRRAGFEIDTAEYDEEQKKYIAPTPLSILTEYALRIATWQEDPSLVAKLSDATVDLWKTYPEIPDQIQRLWNETLLTEHGDITETRDYTTYSISMSRGDVIEHKYKDIKAGVVAGRIVDEGCADGALLARMARDFPDSDLVGVEITREFMAEAHERQRRGDFGSSFVFFYQRNLSEPVFADNSVDTTICNSTTHEIWSYGGGDPTLRKYLAYKYAQLRPSGALVIRDVIGPENGDELIYAWFEDSSGATPPPEIAAETKAGDLSTLGRFYKFAKEFFNGRGVAYTEETINGQHFIKAARKDIADFLSKKNYVDNWDSELHEDFTHWSFSDWKRELSALGFTVDDSLSHTYINPWIVEHHLQGTAELFSMHDGKLIPEKWPPSTVILVARK